MRASLYGRRGVGTYEENVVFANQNAGVRVGVNGAPVMRRNRINKNLYEAIWISDAGSGVYEDNDLRDNGRGAWDVEAPPSAELKRARNIEA